MLLPPLPKLVPPPSWCVSPLVAEQCPATGCRVGRLLGVDLDDQRLDITCARRESSWSMTSRSCRYSGSGAVMISELVAGSAWMKPPVDGPAEPCTGVVRGDRAAPCRRQRGAGAGGECCRRRRCRRAAAAAAGGEGRAQHRGQLHRVGVLRYTTQMFPAGAAPCVGPVELGDDRARRCASCAGLAARTISELLRASASTVERRRRRPGTPGGAGTLPPPAIGQALHQRRQVAGHGMLAAG